MALRSSLSSKVREHTFKVFVCVPLQVSDTSQTDEGGDLTGSCARVERSSIRTREPGMSLPSRWPCTHARVVGKKTMQQLLCSRSHTESDVPVCRSRPQSAKTFLRPISPQPIPARDHSHHLELDQRSQPSSFHFSSRPRSIQALLISISGSS